jgi:hypothetical protein
MATRIKTAKPHFAREVLLKHATLFTRLLDVAIPLAILLSFKR